MKLFAHLVLCLAATALSSPALAAPNYRAPLGCELPDGRKLPARNANFDIDGPGKGSIGVYIYGREVLSPAQAALFGPDDLGAIMERVNETTGQGRFCRVVNVPAELLDVTIYDPGSGRMRVVTELVARAREQAARAGGSTTAAKTRIVLDVEPGKVAVVSVGPG